MTAGSTKPAANPAVVADRDLDLVLAGIHLRLGALGLARAELETLAGRNLLDDPAIRDLAEARWRTGDTAGAGDAAATYLEIDPDDVLALVIAAEAQSEASRPAEARLAGRAVDRANGTLDPLFAGLKRSSIWPAEPGSAVGPVGGLFDGLHPGPVTPGMGFQRRRADRALEPIAPGVADQQDSSADGANDASTHAESSGPGLWGDEPGAALAVDAVTLDPQALFHGARRALDLNRDAEAAAGLILALRGSPGLAPAILDLLAGRADPLSVLVRGDAHRIVGREVEAMRDHAAAAARLVDLVAEPDRTTAADHSTHRHRQFDANAAGSTAAGTAHPAVTSTDSPGSDSSATGATGHDPIQTPIDVEDT
jgi:hypothetical protein